MNWFSWNLALDWGGEHFGFEVFTPGSNSCVMEKTEPNWFVLHLWWGCLDWGFVYVKSFWVVKGLCFGSKCSNDSRLRPLVNFPFRIFCWWIGWLVGRLVEFVWFMFTSHPNKVTHLSQHSIPRHWPPSRGVQIQPSRYFLLLSQVWPPREIQFSTNNGRPPPQRRSPSHRLTLI